MANPEHLSLIKQGVEVWNQWRKDNPESRPDLIGAQLNGVNLIEANLSGVYIEAHLSGAHLNRADLFGADLRGADLSKAKLSEAKLFQVDLSGANLKRADLSEANLFKVNLRRATLSEANLSSAIIREADLSGANLDEANLSGTSVSWTTFGNVDLSQVKGLQEVIHNGPSIIGIGTIYESAGKIPEEFLRGCGLSDMQIAMVKLHKPSLTNEQTTDLLYDIHHLIVLGAIHAHSSFISYSIGDQELADKIYDDLHRSGVRCWFAPEDMPIGGKLREEIDRAISRQENVVLILSENAVNSNWVEDEVERAFEVEKERGKRILLPIRLDDTVLKSEKSWARKVRRRLVGDFCNWQDEGAYQAEFKKLLRSIKATAEGEA